MDAERARVKCALLAGGRRERIVPARIAGVADDGGAHVLVGDRLTVSIGQRLRSTGTGGMILVRASRRTRPRPRRAPAAD